MVMMMMMMMGRSHGLAITHLQEGRITEDVYDDAWHDAMRQAHENKN